MNCLRSKAKQFNKIEKNFQQLLIVDDKREVIVPVVLVPLLRKLQLFRRGMVLKFKNSLDTGRLSQRHRTEVEHRVEMGVQLEADR
jgi:hypothetical protein